MNNETLRVQTLIRNSPFLHNGSYTTSDSTRKTWEACWKLATQSLFSRFIDCSNDADNETINCHCTEYFDKLWNLYTGDPMRYYHTSVHIEEMLNTFMIILQNDMLSSIMRSLQDDDMEPTITQILLAIFFHDAMYDGKSSTNEEDSAKLFENFATAIKMKQELKQQIYNFIMATKTHEVTSDASPALSLFLDLDMAVLGKNQAAYMKYAALIRKEYIFVQEDIYCKKRAEILELFVQNTKLYQTLFMREIFESQARSNILTEIESLRKGIIPM